jgi:hypothetical protein
MTAMVARFIGIFDEKWPIMPHLPGFQPTSLLVPELRRRTEVFIMRPT